MSINVSATLIKDYLLCPKMVYYRLNLPSGGVPNQDMLAGTIVHNTLERYWKDKIQAMNFCVIKCKENNLDTKHTLKVFKSINIFFEKFQWMLSSKDKIEVKFKIKLDTDTFLTGRMDRILENGIIIDWKTSVETPKTIAYDPQFIVYYLAYKLLYKVNPTSVLYISLFDNKMVGFTSNPLLTESMFHGIIPSVVENIKTNNLPPTGLYTSKCIRCQFEEICHYELDNRKINNGEVKT